MLWFCSVRRLTLKDCPDGEKKLGQEKKNQTLCLEKSLIISKWKCTRWEERFSQLEKENQVLKEKLRTNSGNNFKFATMRTFKHVYSILGHVWRNFCYDNPNTPLEKDLRS